ncbi:MAG: mycofactocin biosynthesis chaperone MftB [Kineosporiaceae bacterium]|nr:mycofactocin biosynthesis chaperone MftB [Kineosporiaceae bacterium]MBK7622641.1 mycofactocin biosynthesis chaperone MftB [Kineosporiaceae bacterium]MBK8078622.1 mycofactocin biosynthesis chaperone MftB [Kineosporiaceae bacterium]
MSTDPDGTVPTADQAWQLSPTVALRPEPFGALAYDFATRQLSFLKTTTLLDVVRRLDAAPCIADALSDAGVPTAQRTDYLSALAHLARGGLIRPRPTGRSPR